MSHNNMYPQFPKIHGGQSQGQTQGQGQGQWLWPNQVQNQEDPDQDQAQNQDQNQDQNQVQGQTHGQYPDEAQSLAQIQAVPVQIQVAHAQVAQQQAAQVAAQASHGPLLFSYGTPHHAQAAPPIQGFQQGQGALQPGQGFPPSQAQGDFSQGQSQGSMNPLLTILHAPPPPPGFDIMEPHRLYPASQGNSSSLPIIGNYHNSPPQRNFSTGFPPAQGNFQCAQPQGNYPLPQGSSLPPVGYYPPPQVYPPFAHGTFPHGQGGSRFPSNQGSFLSNQRDFPPASNAFPLRQNGFTSGQAGSGLPSNQDSYISNPGSITNNQGSSTPAQESALPLPDQGHSGSPPIISPSGPARFVPGGVFFQPPSSAPGQLQPQNRKKRPATRSPSPSEITSKPLILRRKRHRGPPQKPIHKYIPNPAYPNAAIWATSNQPFNIYQAIMRHPDVKYQFMLRLPPKSFIDLHAIDKRFHYIVCQKYSSLMHDFAAHHAPDAAFCMPGHLFPDLCISDPTLKPMDNRAQLARDVPSLRWAQMVIYRERVVHDILTTLALAGLHVPRATTRVLLKFWACNELPTQGQRENFLADKSIWSDAELFVFRHFCVKLDMAISNPVFGRGACRLSRLLLSQKSWTLLRDLLIGQRMETLEGLGEIMMRTYQTEDMDVESHPILADEIESGVVLHEWGLLTREKGLFDHDVMQTSVRLLEKEIIRRGLRVDRWIPQMVVWGFIRPKTGENIPSAEVKWERTFEQGRMSMRRRVVLPDEGFPTKKVMDGAVEEMIKKVRMF